MKRVFGHVKWFDIDKGFGFLVREDGGGDALLHANVLKNFGRTSVSEDTKIEFEFLETDKGRQVSKIYNILNSEDIKKGEELTWMYNNNSGGGMKGKSSTSTNTNAERRSSRRKRVRRTCHARLQWRQSSSFSSACRQVKC